jgi:hypothetical protein
MKNTLARLGISLSKIQKQHIQILILLVTIAMLVLGAGAPDSGGGTLNPR